MKQIIGAIFITFLLITSSFSTEYSAKNIRTIDADTQEYSIEIWPGITYQILVRVLWIDTPETRRPNKECRSLERAHGKKATDFVKKLIKPGDVVTISRVQLGKYAGRVLAHIRLKDKRDLGTLLIEKGYAVEYHGGTKPDWCEILE